MKFWHSLRQRQHLQLAIFYVLLIAVMLLTARLSLSTNTVFDWTQQQRHSLSETTLTLLNQLNESIDIEVFISPQHQYLQELTNHLNRYQQQTDKLKISYTDPASAPQRVKQLLIQQQGEIHVRSATRFERVLDLSEQSLTNAIYRIHRSDSPVISFIHGHGERDPNSDSNFGLSYWAEHLRQKGFTLETLYPARTPQIHESVSLLVIASSDKPWLEGEIELIRAYIKQGGNLLWLVEPEQNQHLSKLADSLAIQILPGQIIDPLVAKLGIDDPRFVLISDYANHPITQASADVTLFPTASALQMQSSHSWAVTELLRSQSDTWLRLSPVDDNNLNDLTFDEDLDLPGPFTLGLLLESLDDTTQQRIAIIGDGDFIANSYLGNAANLSLSMNLVEWLTHQDAQLNIPIISNRDNTLTLSMQQTLIMALGFLIVLPLLLVLIGLVYWWVRKRR